jgi:HEAT repeat protein
MGPKGEERSDTHIRKSFLAKLAGISEKDKRLTILKACSKVRAGWVEALFWDALGDPCEEVRDFVVKALCRKDVLDLARALTRLERPPWYARSAALRVLGARRAAESVALIEPVLGDENVDVRREAASALGEIGGKDSLRLLLRLKKDPSPHVRMTAEEGILKISTLRFS